MKPVYAGIFFDERTYNELKIKAAPLLGKSIDHPHLTLEFKPEELLPDEIVGEEIEVLVIGEGNDGINQGFSVKLSDRIHCLYKNTAPPHITTSLDPVKGKAVNTGRLDFRPMVPMTIKGRIGYFTSNGVKYDNNF